MLRILSGLHRTGAAAPRHKAGASVTPWSASKAEKFVFLYCEFLPCMQIALRGVWTGMKAEA
jgi:hypothetical protein